MPAFAKLRLHDSNGDDQLTAADADWTKLRVWRDLNQNGVSEATELKTLTATGIASIALNDVSDDRYVKENYISNVATFKLTTGITREIADVHYLNDNANTWALGAQSQVWGAAAAIDQEALLLPQSRGYGSLPALHLAMARDPGLKTLLKQFDALTPAQLDEVGGRVDGILLRWAGVDAHDPDWRNPGGGGNIDSRKVDFLEEFGGITWAQRGTAPLVGVNASLGVKLSWMGVHAMMTVCLIAQGPLEDVFGESAYLAVTDKLFLTDDLATILGRPRDDPGSRRERDDGAHHRAGPDLLGHAQRRAGEFARELRGDSRADQQRGHGQGRLQSVPRDQDADRGGCAAALVEAERQVLRMLAGALGPHHVAALDDLLALPEETRLTPLGALRSAPAGGGTAGLHDLLDRLDQLRALGLPPMPSAAPCRASPASPRNARASRSPTCAR